MQIFILFYSFIFMNSYLCKKYEIILMQESRDVFVVFIEIIFSHVDVFDSNIKIFW